MQPKDGAQTGSGLKFQLHPLVLINISDHYTRTKLNAPSDGPSTSFRIMGCLLGEQSGRVVDISNSFELKLDDGADVNEAFLRKKMEQYKQTFPQLDVLGWYTTGQDTTDADMAMQKKMMDINEAPVFLLLNPEPNAASNDLPITLYESELHVLDGVPTLTFAKSGYSIQTSEAERIGVDQVVKIQPTGGADASVQLSSHLASIQAAVQMLVTRIEALHDLLNKMQSGEIPFNHSIARQVAALTRRLPAADDDATAACLTVEKCDAMLTVLLTGLTKGVTQANDVADKHVVAYDRMTGSKRATRGGGGGPPMPPGPMI